MGSEALSVASASGASPVEPPSQSSARVAAASVGAANVAR